MDVETRLLLYVVALGAGVSLVTIWRRRAYAFWFHMSVVAALFASAAVGLAWPALGRLVAMPSLIGFCALSLAPSLLLMAARAVVPRRRYAVAEFCTAAASVLLGMPRPIRRERRLWGALAAGDRGDYARCAEEFEALYGLGALPPSQGGAQLAHVVPMAVARRWREVLQRFDDAPPNATALRVIEAHAAAETGDLRRALRACRRLSEGHAATVHRHQARRWTLACAGRATYLEEAERARSPLLGRVRGASDLLIGRAHEAAGDDDTARARYERAARRAPGALRRDADAGLARLRVGTPRRATPDEIETDEILELERSCRDEDAQRLPERRPLATWWLSAITTVVSAAVFLTVGTDAFQLLAVGALSEPLIANEGQWWRLFSPMLLHGGWVHLLLNISSILIIGAPYESRVGAARTILVYLGSGMAGSLASAYLNHTEIGVGASGAAMGLMGALLVLLLRRPDAFESLWRTRWVRFLWLGLGATLALGLLERAVVDNAAHVAGCVAGAALAAMLLPPRRGGDEPGLRRAGRRLAAALVVALAVTACVEAALEARRWLRPQQVVARGVEVSLPGWLRPTPVGRSIVLRRPPAELALLVGAEPWTEVAPSELLREQPALWRIYRREHPEPLFHEARQLFRPKDVAEAEECGPAFAFGFRLETVRNGRAFVLLLLPESPETDALFDELVRGIRESLRLVD